MLNDCLMYNVHGVPYLHLMVSMRIVLAESVSDKFTDIIHMNVIVYNCIVCVEKSALACVIYQNGLYVYM